MTTLVSADWHLTDQPKDRYRFTAIEFLLDLVAKRHVERFIILGDLTHYKNHHSDVLVNDIVGFLHEFTRLCPVYILQGNHDYVEANNAFFQFVRLMKDITWIWTPQIIALSGLGKCWFLPHTRDYKKDWGVFEQGKATLFFAHNAFEGAVAESGKRLSGIPLSIFPKNIPIISGDIHEPQCIGNLTYVGSPYTQKYGDNFEPRVLLVDSDGIESISVPGPRHLLFDISDVDQLEKLPDPNRYNMYDMIRLRYRLRAGDCDKWPEIKKEITAFFCAHTGSVQVQPILEQISLPQQRSDQPNKNDKQLVREFGEQQRASPGTMVTGYELLA